eukprot:TRINITY_DN1927_c0_g1_i2.p1 TRINITY_DN1927_c0_g1~~TRINITY_DN1927_c0_g1_i2.p1  ORF type:complete len:234 (+),score=18.54 TRINITY_DN1927_c0_g1_i2:105-806(+)
MAQTPGEEEMSSCEAAGSQEAERPLGDVPGSGENGVETCAVCLEEAPHVQTPCCYRPGATVGYCRHCLDVICADGGGGVGRCPSCRKYIRIDAEGHVHITDQRAKCRCCQQSRVILDEGRCDACLLGMRFPFTYECNRCHKFQKIPHPMWRYQPSPTEFGSSSWACHRGCCAYTKWRIVAEDAERIPGSELPESWGGQEEWLATVRDRSLRNQAARGQGGLAAPSSDSRCTCM